MVIRCDMAGCGRRGVVTDDWKFDVPTRGSIKLPPDARYMEALTSQGYGFEASIADLVDNSIDAGAKDVIIHFLRDSDRLVSLLVIDDGCGMDEKELDVAMTVGARQGYRSGSLGMFGTGLKSASLSHASAVTVATRTKRTMPVGRRWAMQNALAGFECDIVDEGYAQELIDRYNGIPITWHGTVIRWDGVKDFPTHGGGAQTDRYLTRTINKLGLHLGLQLHRFLERSDFNITIAVEDIHTGDQYMNFGVEPLNPFGYPVSGDPEYPKTFVMNLHSIGEVSLDCHIWTPKSNLDEYRAIGSVLEKQGFYFYRNDRLVQAGGWNNYRQPEQHLSLARVAVDLPDTRSDVFRLTVKKDGVEVSPEFVSTLDSAVSSNGTMFGSYIQDAVDVYRTARQRAGITRKPVIPPGSGVARLVKDAVEGELESIPGEEPIDIRWENLDDRKFFDIDREARSIRLNKMYRSSINGGRSGSLNDAPMIKALMYILLHETFEKEYAGKRAKDNISLWQSILSAAAESEMER